MKTTMKAFPLLLIVGLLVSLSCSNPASPGDENSSSSSSKPSQAVVQQDTQMAMTAYYMGYSSATNKGEDGNTITYSNADNSVSYSYTYTTYPAAYPFFGIPSMQTNFPITSTSSLTFSSYTYSGITVNGSLTMDITIEETFAFEYIFDGTLAFSGAGYADSLEYDTCTIAFDGTNITYSGTIIVSGYAFDFAAMLSGGTN
jgi:hypothetical protein